jgi:2-polyprenyl-3-methyl-5-hydroxy-6-metoxy-1,4-benzoquinol methylase
LTDQQLRRHFNYFYSFGYNQTTNDIFYPFSGERLELFAFLLGSQAKHKQARLILNSENPFPFNQAELNFCTEHNIIITQKDSISAWNTANSVLIPKKVLISELHNTFSKLHDLINKTKDTVIIIDNTINAAIRASVENMVNALSERAKAHWHASQFGSAYVEISSHLIEISREFPGNISQQRQAVIETEIIGEGIENIFSSFSPSNSRSNALGKISNTLGEIKQELIPPHVILLNTGVDMIFNQLRLLPLSLPNWLSKEISLSPLSAPLKKHNILDLLDNLTFCLNSAISYCHQLENSKVPILAYTIPNLTSFLDYVISEKAKLDHASISQSYTHLQQIVASCLYNTSQVLSRQACQFYFYNYWDESSNVTIQELFLGSGQNERPTPFPIKLWSEYNQFYQHNSRASSTRSWISVKQANSLKSRIDFLAETSTTDHFTRYVMTSSFCSALLGLLQERSPGRPIRWVDFGCGLGIIPMLCGLPVEFYGVDINSSNCQSARNAAKALNLSTFNFVEGNALDLMKSGDIPQADLITCFEFVEHIPDPLLFLRTLRPYCSGIVLIASPFAEPLPCHPVEEHVWSFSEQSFQSLLHAAGYTPIVSNVLKVGAFSNAGHNWLATAGSVFGELKVFPSERRNNRA